MTLQPPARTPPKQIVVRFRHPDDKPIRSVTVNGAPWTEVDAAKGEIRLPGQLGARTEIVVAY